MDNFWSPLRICTRQFCPISEFSFDFFLFSLYDREAHQSKLEHYLTYIEQIEGFLQKSEKLVSWKRLMRSRMNLFQKFSSLDMNNCELFSQMNCKKLSQYAQTENL